MRRTYIVLALAICFSGLAQQTPSLNLTVAGEKTWTVRLGLGTAELLSGEGLSPGQIALTQTLRADIEGKALGFLTLRASFNDQLGAGFQDFLLIADHAPWTGELGRFVVGAEGEGLGVYNKRVLGARVAFTGDAITMGGLFARMEGISESRTFRGEQRTAAADFAATESPDSWQPAPYRNSVEGLSFWNLRASFVEGLTRVRLRLSDAPELWALLSSWGLGFLEEDLRQELAPSLSESDYVVLRGDTTALALRIAPEALTRRRITDAIEAHNARLGLTGGARRTYPFVDGSELETDFLVELAAHLAVLVDDADYPFSVLQRRRYLFLGERDVIEGSVEVFIRLPGETELRPSTDPALSEFTWVLLAREGFLRISFPSAFFEGGAVRASYSYRQEGGAFSLGLSVVPNSERVSKNGILLTRGTDYTLDYEAGFLILFSVLGADEELKVDYERQRGGLGVITDYERGFFGFALSSPAWEDLRISIYQARDFGSPGPTTRTMPNTQTVLGASLRGTIAEWDYRLTLGGSTNVFPPGHNARDPLPNRVNSITTATASDGQYVVFAHQNGLTVFKDGVFSNYSAAHGMTGRAAQAVVAIADRLVVGTDAGLTVIRLTESAPFDRVRSWTRLYPDAWNKDRITDRLEGRTVLALAQAPGGVYFATEAELVVSGAADVEDPKRWTRISFPHERIQATALLSVGDTLYMGTTEGLLIRDASGWSEPSIVPTRVHAMIARGEEVFVASADGVRLVRGHTGAGWVVHGTPVFGLALDEGRLWYVTGEGLWREGDAHPEISAPITAVGLGAGAIWAGEEADPESHFDLNLWRLGERPEPFEPRQTKIDGQDTGRFRDIAAVDHTLWGAAGSFTVLRSVANWRLEVSGFSRLPGYAEIGRAGTSDTHGIGFTARYSGANSSLDLLAQWDMADLTTRSTGKLTGRFEWRLTGQPSWALSILPTLTGAAISPFDRADVDWRASVSGKGGVLAWKLSTTGTARFPELSATGQLGADLALNPADGWVIDAKWTRPFRTQGPGGEQRIDLALTWKFDERWVSGTATAQEVVNHHLVTGSWRADHLAKLDLRWAPWLINRSELAPRLAGSWKATPSEWRWDARLDVALSQPGSSLRLVTTLNQGFRAATERSDRTLSFSLTWDPSGWSGLRPSLSWSRSWTILSHPRYPDQATEKEELVFRAIWEPAEARWRDTLSVTWRPGEASVLVSNRLTWPLTTGSISALTTLNLKGAKWTGKATAQLSLPLDNILSATGASPVGEAWGVTAEAGYSFGHSPSEGGQHALQAGLTLAVRF